MDRTRVRGRLPALVCALVLGIAGLVGTTPAALADSYDDACSAPTSTISGSSSAAISVGPSSVILITGGTFSGGVNAWDATGVVCVAAPGRSRRPT